MSLLTHFLVLFIGERTLALPLSSATRVIRAVEVTPLSESPPRVMGVINLQGQIVPVFTLRDELTPPAREVEPGDQFVITSMHGQAIALWVDRAEVGQTPAEPAKLHEPVHAEFEFIRHVLKWNDTLVPLVEVESLLSAEDRARLDSALTRWEPINVTAAEAKA